MFVESINMIHYEMKTGTTSWVRVQSVQWLGVTVVDDDDDDDDDGEDDDDD